MSWTDERVALLSELWDSGMGTAEIGERLGMTKNAIIGKAHRIGLRARRASPKRRPARIVRMNERTCQWPSGDPGDVDFHMCGDTALEGKPYCPEHYARAYIPSRRDRDRRIAVAVA